MKMTISKIFKRQHLCCLLLFIVSCTSPQEKSLSKLVTKDSLFSLQKEKEIFLKIAEEKKEVQSGDLILRTGRDFTSDIMRRVSENDTTYSHCGIAVWEHDSLFVYHALGGQWNPDQKVRRDSYEFFCNPYENRGFGIYRYLVSKSDKNKYIEAARELAKHVVFDMQFDLASDEKMYCSEYVFKSMKIATGDSVKIPTSMFNETKFVSIDNLFINSIAKKVTRVKY